MKKFIGTLSCATYIFIVLLVSSCQSDLESSDFINIVKQYDIYVTQILTESGGAGAIEFRSIDEHDCENAYLSFQANIDDKKAEIILNDVEVEGVCIESPDYVTETVDVKVSNDSKDLIINIQGAVENIGRFSSNTKEFHLNLESNDGLKINKAKINRINENLVWGHFNSSSLETIAQLDDIFESMDLKYLIEKGDYGLFYVDQNGLVIEQGYDQGDLSTFILFSKINFEELINHINLLSENDASLVFHATNYDGNSINIQ